MHFVKAGAEVSFQWQCLGECNRMGGRELNGFNEQKFRVVHSSVEGGDDWVIEVSYEILHHRLSR